MTDRLLQDGYPTREDQGGAIDMVLYASYRPKKSYELLINSAVV